MPMSEAWSWISENLPRLCLVLHLAISTALFYLENLSILHLHHHAGQISLAEDRKAIQGALQENNSEFRRLTGVYKDVFFKGEFYVFQWNEIYVLLIELVANLPDDPVLEPLVHDNWIGGIKTGGRLDASLETDICLCGRLRIHTMSSASVKTVVKALHRFELRG